MSENETTQESSVEESKSQESAVESTDKKEKKEMPVKARKITGVVIMVIGATIAVMWSPMAGMMIFLGGMWAYNPEVKDNSDNTIVPTWLGTLLIIAVVVLVAWLYKSFIM
jgi:cation transport ATPase